MGTGLTANKGEWSEFYTLIKLLTDKRVYGADENVERLTTLYYPILSIVVGASDDKKRYDIAEDSTITIRDNNSHVVRTIESDSLKASVQSIFHTIKTASDRTFEIQEAAPLLSMLGLNKVQADSHAKSDIILVLHDQVTGTSPEVGFSIKSEVGSAPTLLNASGATNFIFKIKGAVVDVNEINDIDTSSKVRDRLHAITAAGGELIFQHCSNGIFENNLRKIDSLLPEVLAEMLLFYFMGEGSRVDQLASKVGESNIFERYTNLPSFITDTGFYEFKVKQFLMSVALGMMAATAWDGLLEAHGGYLIVKEDGDILCYHLYNLDKFRDYLYINTKFDTPSTSRHDFGTLYEENGEIFIRLNLQIRFLR